MIVFTIQNILFFCKTKTNTTMKKRKLLIAVLTAAVTVAGGGIASAEVTKTSLFTTENGYAEVTDLPTDAAELSKYYYVIADANNERILQLADGKSGQNASGKVMEYVDVNDPVSNQYDLWIIEHNTDGYHIRNMAYSGFLMQTEEGTERWKDSNNKDQSHAAPYPWYRRTNDQPHACKWTKVNFEKESDGNFLIKNLTSTYIFTSAHVEEPHDYYFGYWTSANNQFEVASNKLKGDADLGHYKVYAILRSDYMSKYISANLTDNTKGVDLSNFLMNPKVLGTRQYKDNVEGYTITNTGGNRPFSASDNCEFWNGSAANLNFTMSQTVSVPNGKYALTASMYNSSNDIVGDAPNGNVGAFANDKYVGINIDSSEPNDYTIENIVITDGTLTFGYKTNGTPGARWFVGKGFTLTYYGEDLSAYVEGLKETIAQAEGITPAANAASNKALNDVITEVKGVNENDKGALIEANSKLKTAIEVYNAAKTAYDSYTDMKKYAESMQEGMSVVSEEDKTTLTETIKEQETIMNETAATAEAIKTCEDAITAACKEYVGKANPEQNETFDITRLYLVNSDLTNIPTGACEGWYNDLPNTVNNRSVHDATPATGDGEGKDSFYEIYSEKGALVVGKGIYQKATLPAGTYKMEAWGFSRAANNVSTGDGYISAFANETLGAPIVANSMTKLTTAFTLDAEAETMMGLYIAEGNKGNWAGCGYMKLYKYNKSALDVAKATYDEAKATAQKLVDSKMQASVLEKLKKEINATVEETVKAYEDATDSIVKATNSANVSVIAYASLKPELEKAATKNYQTREAFDKEFTAYAVAKKGYDEGTLTTEEATAMSKANYMLNEYRTYLREIVKDYKNATVYVKNALVKDTDGDAYKNSSDKGWKFTTNATATGVSASQNSVDYTGIFMENWRDNKDGGLNGNISQTIQNLPAGKYFLKMVAFTRNAGVNDYIYIKSGDNEEKGAILIAGTPSITLTEPLQINNGTVEIGLHVEGSDWAAWNVVELYAYSIDDVTRTVQTGMYGTVCLPYNATVTGATLYEATVDATNNVVNLTETTGNMEQGKAYIYQATADEQTFKFVDDANLIKDAATGEALTGVFTQTAVPVGAYVMQKHDDADVQKFYKVTGEGISLNAYRAYLNVPTTANAKAMKINLNGATGIDAINALTEGNAVIYDLNGNRLNKLQHGINIVNGVKVVVK